MNGFSAIGQGLRQFGADLQGYGQNRAAFDEMVQRRVEAIRQQQLLEEQRQREKDLYERQLAEQKRIDEQKAAEQKRMDDFRKFAAGQTQKAEPAKPYMAPGLGPQGEPMAPPVPERVQRPSREEMQQKALELGVYGDQGVRSYFDDTAPDKTGGKESYRDIIIPKPSLPAWGRSLDWYNEARKADPSINQIDLMERFVREQVNDGISQDDARNVQTHAASRINQVYGTGIRNPWQGVEDYVDAAMKSRGASELGITPPGMGGSGGSAGGDDPAPQAWSKETRQAITDIVEKAKSSYGFKEQTDSIANAQKVLETQGLAAQTPAALAASITAVARMMAPGVVTDRDFAVLTDYGAPAGIRAWDKLSQWVTGQPPEKKAEIIAGISEMLSGAAKRNAGKILKIAYQQVRSTGLNVDRNQLWDFIAPGAAMDYLEIQDRAPDSEDRKISAEDKKAISWAKKNPNDPRAAQILKRLGM